MQTEGERIKLIRRALNDISQQEFADLFGVSRAYISNVEKDRKNLSRDNLRYLLVNHNLNVNYILEGIGDMFITTSTKSLEEIDAEFERKYDALMARRKGQ